MSSVSRDYIPVFSEQWAYTTRDSAKPALKAPFFRNEYVVTFSDGEHAAMASMSPHAEIGSIQRVFERLREQDVSPDQTKVVVMGGWRDGVNNRYGCGQEILSLLENNGFKNIRTQKMVRQPTANSNEPANPNNSFSGALVDARSGKTFILHQEDFPLNMAKIAHSGRLSSFQSRNGSIETHIPISEAPAEALSFDASLENILEGLLGGGRPSS